jgi:branched-chain amino acid transport system ATP-binding protein
MALVPQGRRVFASLSVRENLEVARAGSGRWNLAEVYTLCPRLAERAQNRANKLSGGEQQMLAIGRALMANPRLLLLDEVSLGLAPLVVRRIYQTLPEITGGGATVILVEQDIGQALAAADRVYCLLEGRVALEGAPRDLDRDRIAAAYFGVRA